MIYVLDNPQDMSYSYIIPTRSADMKLVTEQRAKELVEQHGKSPSLTNQVLGIVIGFAALCSFIFMAG